MRRVFTVLTVPLIVALGSLVARGDPVTFRGPFAINNVPRPLTTVQTGDINKDGKLDIIASNGTNTVTIYVQDSSDRRVWTPIPVRVGSSCPFSRGADFDGDGYDDLAVADGSSTAYYVRSKGDGTFETPVALKEARGARWITIGDWNNDGRLEMASSNLNSSTVTFYLNLEGPDGKPMWKLTQAPPSGREHTMEALDFDGDKITDIGVGQGIPGIQLHKGRGDGTFQLIGTAGNLGCVEYISTGDLNGDGLDDFAPTCIDDSNAYVGLSQGLVNGRVLFKQILKYPFASGTESSAIGDFNRDGFDDVALVSNGSGIVKVFLSTGDGALSPPLDFGPTGTGPVFLIARDLDGDGYMDVISADQQSSTITILWGRDGERFLESADSVTGFGSAKDSAVTDFDGDGVPDLVFVSATLAKASVYLKPGGSSPTQPSFTTTLTNKYSTLAVADMDADGVQDLVGTNLTADLAFIAFLTKEGAVREEVSFQPGEGPAEVKVGPIDGGPTLDMAIVRGGVTGTPGTIVLYLGTGGGKFGDPILLPTIEKAKHVFLGDLDGDTHTDLVVIATRVLAVHYGDGTGAFTEPVSLLEDATKTYNDAYIGDQNGDGITDLLVGESRTLGIFALYGKGNRLFQEAVNYKAGVAPLQVLPVDIDGDGSLDLTASSAATQAVVVLFSDGQGGYLAPTQYRVGVPVASHAFLDLNSDGIVDLLALGSASATIRLGERAGPPPPVRFRRGDADGNGRIQINDAVAALNFLFSENNPLSCQDAADFDDDGAINLTDAVNVLNWLFRDGAPPAAPGPTQCGEDVGADDLAPCKASCGG